MTRPIDQKLWVSEIARTFLFTIALLFAAPLFAAQPEGKCSFHLPSIEQNKEYISHLQDLVLFKDCHTEGSYLYYQQWYADRAPSRRLASRGLAILIIVLAAILPLVVHLQKTQVDYKIWVSLIGALIVISQGLSQTFAYDTAWRNFMLARMKLEVAHDAWQHEMIKASLRPEDGLTYMEAATDNFSKRVAEIVLEETAGFFTAVEEASKARNAGTTEITR